MHRPLDNDLPMTFTVPGQPSALPASLGSADPSTPPPGAAPDAPDMPDTSNPPAVAQPAATDPPSSPSSTPAPAPALAAPSPPPTPVLAMRIPSSPPPPAPLAPMPDLPPELQYLRDLDCQQLWDLLDEDQTKVMPYLLHGDGPTWAAEKSKVARSNIYHWKGQPLFKAIYELLKHHKLAENRDSVNMLGTRAVRVVIDALNRNNAKIAMQLLKQLGVFERRE